MAGMIRKEISDEVKQAEHFAILVDETKDIAKKEQISIVVRYLHDRELHEEFLDYTPAEGLGAESLLQKIKETLAKCKIDHNTCVGQCYGVAAVMSGCTNGVQKIFRRDVSQAVYIHCYAHRLNLVLVDCEQYKVISEFFVTIQSLCTIFSLRWWCIRNF
ncbi:zinc finger MYM-type protein 1-like [Oratosquilla oratoria]|uniref:zinc finger MYM-type protein 1-like n=1 Tax=Oratosquilla oratoria TaxID=337810 RepID=UPI003F758A88